MIARVLSYLDTINCRTYKVAIKYSVFQYRVWPKIEGLPKGQLGGSIEPLMQIANSNGKDGFKTDWQFRRSGWNIELMSVGFYISLARQGSRNYQVRRDRSLHAQSQALAIK